MNKFLAARFCGSIFVTLLVLSISGCIPWHPHNEIYFLTSGTVPAHAVEPCVVRVQDARSGQVLGEEKVSDRKLFHGLNDPKKGETYLVSLVCNDRIISSRKVKFGKDVKNGGVVAL